MTVTKLSTPPGPLVLSSISLVPIRVLTTEPDRTPPVAVASEEEGVALAWDVAHIVSLPAHLHREGMVLQEEEDTAAGGIQLFQVWGSLLSDPYSVSMKFKVYLRLL